MVNGCVELWRSIRTVRPSLRTWLKTRHLPDLRCRVGGAFGFRRSDRCSRHEGPFGSPKRPQKEGARHRCDAHELDESQQRIRVGQSGDDRQRKSKKQADEAPACTPVTKPIRGRSTSAMWMDEGRGH